MPPCLICPNCDSPYVGAPRSGILLHLEDVMRADRRMYVNADRSKLVEEGDPDAAILLAAEGDDIPAEDVERLGLNKRKPDQDPVVVHSIAADPPKKEEAPPRTKAVSGPPENKARATAKKDDEDQ